MNTEEINRLEIKADELENIASSLRQQAYDAKMERIEESDGNMKEWLNITFESSSGLTEEFSLFSRDFRKCLVKQMSGYKLLNFNRGHFYLSGFFRNNANGKIIYFSTSDVRHFPDAWYEGILIRTAEHDKDYTGGSNYETSFKDFKKVTDRLIETK